MKIRLGFVSNSSSASFVIDVQRYPDVFSVAEEFLKRLYMMSLEDHLDGYKSVLFLDPIETLAVLEDAAQKGANRNRTVEFAGSCGTHIGRFKSCYVINTEEQYHLDGLWPTCKRFRNEQGVTVEEPELLLEKDTIEPALDLTCEYLEQLGSKLEQIVHNYYHRLLEVGDWIVIYAIVISKNRSKVMLEFDEGPNLEIPANYVIEPYENDSSDVQDLTFAYFPHSHPGKK